MRAAATRRKPAITKRKTIADPAPFGADASYRAGESLLAQGRAVEAAVMLTPVCAAHPAHPGLHRLHARALTQLGQHGPAIGALFVAVRLHPDAGTYAELAIALFADQQAEAALAHCLEAFRLAPIAANATTLGCILIDLGRFDEALTVIVQGLVQQPQAMELMINHAIVLEELGHYEAAMTAGRAALALYTDAPAVRHTLAAALLSDGMMTAEAWQLYEGRLPLTAGSAWRGAELRWTGGPINGRTVLLHAEQGVGDTLQFVRYAPLVAAMGARVVLMVQKPLLRLLQGTPGVAEIAVIDGTLPPFDVFTPLCSLPMLLGTTIDTIPPPLPYTLICLNVTAAASSTGALRVGVVWSGNPAFVLDRKRSIDPALLSVLAGIPGVTFHSLQIPAGAMPPGLEMIDLMQDVQDFADTAERIAGLDLVIAVDTAVAHLAATMNKPVWLLSRYRGCWRWLREREDSPWYPSIRIFRQERPNDWAGVLRRVRRALLAMCR